MFVTIVRRVLRRLDVQDELQLLFQRLRLHDTAPPATEAAPPTEQCRPGARADYDHRAAAQLTQLRVRVEIMGSFMIRGD
eukprot:COSAG01_NODE_4445_length_5016_cov_92.960545_5_plen_80_part_00